MAWSSVISTTLRTFSLTRDIREKSIGSYLLRISAGREAYSRGLESIAIRGEVDNGTIFSWNKKVREA